MSTDDYDLFLIISSSSKNGFRGPTKILQLPSTDDSLGDLLHVQKRVGCGHFSMKTNMCAREVIDLLAANGFYVYNTIYHPDHCDWFILHDGQEMRPFCK
uniref:Histone-lysine N-methyltransferase SETMAR n=1 Tax=Steinernema glaseri TaxID=37863 RepID=A0A1I8ABL4_9BILA